MHIIYPNYDIVIKCYYEEQNLTEKNKELLNDAGCYLHHVPNPRKKKERSDMLIIRDLFDMKETNIVGLISSDGDFLPYLTKLKDKNIELFVITNNKKYDATTKFKMSYSFLKRSSKLKYFAPCFKHYLTDHVKGQFAKVSAPEYEIAIFLPTADWAKGNPNKVYADSRKIISGI